MTESGAVTLSAGTPSAATPSAGAGEAAQVAAFWRDLGLPGLVDIHTHFMPPNVLAKVWAFFEGGHAGVGHAWPIAYRRPEEERVALLRDFGVRRFSALLYPHKPDMAAWLNSWAAAFAARTPDALHSATFFPEPGAAGYVAEAIGAGARVFKAHLQVGAYDPRDELLDGVWGMLAEARLPVVVHCGSGPYPGRFTGPGPISVVLARHPRLTMIVAHLGAPSTRTSSISPAATPAFTWTPRWRSPGSSNGSRRSRRHYCRGWPPQPTESCWAPTSRTSRIPTCTSWRRWPGWTSARRGCARSATTTRCGC